MAKALSLPALSPEDGLRRYMQEIQKFPILAADEEYALAKRWTEDMDYEAAHQLVTSHLRLVAKIAMGYRGYGLPISEVVSEGNVGLMQAVKRFEPEKGFRLATYAMWWIRASTPPRWLPCGPMAHTWNCSTTQILKPAIGSPPAAPAWPSYWKRSPILSTSTSIPMKPPSTPTRKAP